jgi:uncharacterized protein (DUF697 family)
VLADLTSAQASELCGELTSYLDGSNLTTGLLDYECKLTSILGALAATTDAAAQAACSASYSECKMGSGGTVTNGQCTPPGSTCTATVGELQMCLSDFDGFAKALEATPVPSCTGLTLTQVQATLASFATGAGANSMEPASCTTYSAKCPDNGMVPLPMP